MSDSGLIDWRADSSPFSARLSEVEAAPRPPSPPVPSIPMHCYVYASQRKSETYVWTREPATVTELPSELTQLLGDLKLVLEISLDESHRLPRENPRQILDELRRQGWYLQLPAQESQLQATPQPA